ncbi:uncharacterized protein LOC130784560 isoform X1 [Actinidia eriantha]|uniref:uncharacterized protein LOC130784560 isoform X1 n=1 Tax=Actinidia eriantha TaxID=165200 RepID=UPI00258DBD89|nr:uncharacterized protein LOC130784560 isoform X1 [Actinidia eriantha]
MSVRERRNLSHRLLPRLWCSTNNDSSAIASTLEREIRRRFRERKGGTCEDQIFSGVLVKMPDPAGVLVISNEPRGGKAMVEEMTSESSNGSSRLIRTLADVKYGNHHLTTVEIVYNCISFVVAIVITFAFTIHAKRTLSEHQCRIQQYSPWLRPQQL